MNHYKIRLYAVSSLILLSAFLATPSTAKMTMKEAVAETLNTNPEILADKSAASSDKHVIRRAQAGYLPTLDVRASGGYEHTKTKFKRNSCSNTDTFCTQDKLRTSPGVTAIQPVFDGWRTPTNVDRARADYILSEKRVDETKEALAFRAIGAFIDVRRFQRLVRLTKQNVEAHEKIALLVDQLIDGGRASIADRHTVQSRLSDARAAVVDIQGDLGVAIARFKSVVGVEPDRLGTAAVPDEIMPANIDQALETAQEQNRSVIVAKAAVDVAEAALRSSSVPFWPTLAIEANAEQNRNTSGRQGYGNTANVLGVARYNVYNGGADAARMAEASETVAERKHRLEAAKRTAEEETRQSWAERRSAQLQAKDLKESVIEKYKVRAAFRKQYDLGRRTLLDLLDAENEFFLARGALITVEATIDLTEARLLASMGTLVKKFGLDVASPTLDQSSLPIDISFVQNWVLD